MSEPQRRPAWERLSAHAKSMVDAHLREVASSAERSARMRVRMGELTVDLSKQRIDDVVLQSLIELGRETDLESAMRRMQEGELVNTTEQRPALHTALRVPASQGASAVITEVIAERERLFEFARQLRSARFTGHTGRPIRDIVHIGIGGSHLGPELVTKALRNFDDGRFHVHFLSNVDGHAIESVLPQLDSERTLFIVASKSFSTIETRVNAEAARAWMLERGCALADLSRHFVAISTNVAACTEFGIARASVFPMWDWVGGRYSVWSAVGLPVLLAIGEANFSAFLAGAHMVDRHTLTTPLERNVPMLLALIGVWNFNFLGAQSHVVLVYDHRLALLPDYLQQLEMESNGKSTTQSGERVQVHTMPVLWGGEGTNGQHAYHQQLHQGTRAFAADLIACVAPHHARTDHHRWLLANCLSQSEAMLKGRLADELRDDALAAHKVVPGNHATTTILLDSLTPSSLGALLALYEHKVYCQGMIWDVNPFDQWGVELGKTLGEAIHRELTDDAHARHDPSTRALIDQIKSSLRSRS